VQLREKDLVRDELRELARRVVEMAHAHGAKVLLNGDVELAREVGADGVQLTVRNSRNRASGRRWIGVPRPATARRSYAGLKRWDAISCCCRRCCDQVSSGCAASGLESFAAIAAGSTIPVYALGGLQPGDMKRLGSMARTASRCCVRPGDRIRQILFALFDAIFSFAHFPGRSSCSVRCRTGGSGCRCPIPFPCRIEGRRRQASWTLRRQAAEGQFERDVLVEQRGLCRIVAAMKRMLMRICSRPLRDAGKVAVQADAQHLGDAAALHLLERAVVGGEAQHLAAFAQ